MAFEVIPALDIAGGRLVRTSADGPVAVEAFAGDPLAAARAFVDAGAGRLHVVDVDLANGSAAGNLDLLAEIVALGVPVQASGGVWTAAEVETLRGAGADRVVLGSAALASREGTEELVASFGFALVVGVEADGPTITSRGGGPELPLWDTLTWLAELDVRRFLFTEVGRVGALAGPDLDGVWALATHTGKPVIAAGGIRGTEDLRALAALGPPVEGGVVGRALYEGLDLSEALAVSG